MQVDAVVNYEKLRQSRNKRLHGSQVADVNIASDCRQSIAANRYFVLIAPLRHATKRFDLQMLAEDVDIMQGDGPSAVVHYVNGTEDTRRLMVCGAAVHVIDDQATARDLAMLDKI